MVKVQKPNPKTLKKDVPEKPKNIQKKKPTANATKEKVKAMSKVLENVAAKNKVTKAAPQKKEDVLNKKGKKVQQKEDVLNKNTKKEQKKEDVSNKNTKKVPQKEEKTVQKKKPVVAGKAENKTQKVVEVEVKKNLKKKQNEKEKETTDKKSTASGPIFEPTDFNEELFKQIVSLDNIKKIAKALKTLVEKQVSEKKTSIFSDYKYLLNVASYKIPNCPKRMVKLNVKHALVETKLDDVVIIVPDLQRGAKVDYEPTIQHYEDLLRENGLDNIKVVPFNQLRQEVTTFEAKRKFANTYDYFLCDGRIVSHVVGFCGSHFQKPRSTIHAVRLDNPKTIKSDVEHALKRTAYKQLHKGDLVSIPVGNHRFTINQVAENVETVIKQLKTIFAGGYPNIRNIFLKIDIAGTSALPIYANLMGAPQETPNVIGPREQKMLKLKKEANEILSKFSMSKTGDFVKLDKKQVERKKQIREAKAALLSKDKEVVDENEDSELTAPPAKKVKKAKQVEVEEDENEEEESADDEVEEGDDDDEEDEEDDDDDNEEGGDDDDEEDSDEE